MSVGTVTAWELPHHPTYLYVVPMFHCNGWGHAWTMTLMAATIVLTRTITAEAIFGEIEKHQITHFGGAPIVLSLLVNAPEETRPELDYKIKVLTAGAPPPAAMLIPPPPPPPPGGRINAANPRTPSDAAKTPVAVLKP